MPKEHLEPLIHRALDGDRAAAEALLVSLQPFIRSFLFRLLGSADGLDDLQQIVLLRVYEQLPTFRFGSALRTWVGAICIHAARDSMRRQKVREATTSELGEQGTPADAMGARLDARRELNRFEQSLQKLSVAQRTALVLRSVEGYSVEEVATMMKSAVSTTRMRLYFARKIVAAEMARLHKGKR